MKTPKILLAGIIATMSFAGISDRAADDRYRIKSGRGASALADPAPACCQRLHSAKNVLEEKAMLKLGRVPESQQKDTALHVKKCIDAGNCALVHAQAPENTTPAKMKYGRDATLHASAASTTCTMECCKH